MPDRSLVLVVNPGSSSRKYSLFSNDEKLVSINFEFEDGQVVAKITKSDEKYQINLDDPDFSLVASYVLSIATDYKVIDDSDKIKAIGVRLVAPSQRFMKDELVTDDTVTALEEVQKKAPLHIGTALAEIKQLRNHFPSTPIITISDSAFHAGRPDYSTYYGVDIDLADKLDVKRFGFHGLSVGSVAHKLKANNLLASKTIVCHLGSGSSITALLDGQSLETSMGYTPLEGLMMATRCGNIDPSAVMALKKELNLADNQIEDYLNKNCGLLGVSGSSSEIKQLLGLEANGDQRAKLAIDMLTYRIQLTIGQMATSLDGVDQIIFTATVGERSGPIRQRVMEKLSYLGFKIDQAKNDDTFEPKEITNLAAKTSKPILVVATDEAAEIARRVQIALTNK